MAIFSEQEHRLKSGETAIVRSAQIDDAAALLAHAKAVTAEDIFGVTTAEEFDFTEEKERDWIRKYGDDIRMYRFVKDTVE